MAGRPQKPGSWRRAILAAVIQQILALFLLGLTTDAGGLDLVWFYTVCAFWVGVAVVAIRRGKSPTGLDMALVRIGFLPLLLMAMFVAALVWHARGLR